MGLPKQPTTWLVVGVVAVFVYVLWDSESAHQPVKSSVLTDNERVRIYLRGFNDGLESAILNTKVNTNTGGLDVDVTNIIQDMNP